MKQISKNINVKDTREAINIFGTNDEILRFIEKEFRVKLIARGHSLIVNGGKDTVLVVENIFNNLKSMHNDGEHIHLEAVKKLSSLYKDEERAASVDLLVSNENAVAVPSKKRFIKPKTDGQRKYIEAIRKRDMIFAIGPAGTGKTYLAVAMAVSALQSGSIDRIVLTRPAVEAGEKLGFLPGTFQEKVNPYLRPLYDAMYDMMDIERFMELMQRDVVEVAPLAYMRGRTLNNCFIILDEAQNTTPEQMKMFITRLGFGSKAVITGDTTQIDLPKEKESGLVFIERILKDIKEIIFIHLTARDAVRHDLVQKIIVAFEKHDKK
ncbi:MAG: phosphate starvation-inducible protein PhoH [Candidatus Firestonebacteria bacterium RIFOXYC2_FULL_39_67]|nr:MAG: phosphate starvation-inducible protein PhoH [Candidatus Firestonebacteria bacterium RIFOXYD2_FULL_39_29]OGF53072.1 MAG: phosphate starvation-inducible protein PhoH [Candidatus Firestonebacteria bacterium RifOxyC12_full_39_7]OGF57150.1 MAG: phosphate starvation-inducible protein PhoH [Candidatus Firestonebacteria bacterium RIFOXYC2_FULL_39_67]